MNKGILSFFFFSLLSLSVFSTHPFKAGNNFLSLRMVDFTCSDWKAFEPLSDGLSTEKTLHLKAIEQSRKDSLLKVAKQKLFQFSGNDEALIANVERLKLEASDDGVKENLIQYQGFVSKLHTLQMLISRHYDSDTYELIKAENEHIEMLLASIELNHAFIYEKMPELFADSSEVVEVDEEVENVKREIALKLNEYIAKFNALLQGLHSHKADQVVEQRIAMNLFQIESFLSFSENDEKAVIFTQDFTCEDFLNTLEEEYISLKELIH